MNRRRTVVPALWAVILLAGPGNYARSETTSYHIGNSLTWDSQPLGVEAFAALRGHEHDVGHHIACSLNLNEIWSNPDFTCVPPTGFGEFSEALANHRLDAVTLQPFRSGEATLGEDTARAIDFINLARSNPQNEETEFFLYTGWPQLGGSAEYWTQDVEDNDETRSVTAREYFPLLADRVRAATDAQVFIVPVGEVFFQLDQRIQAGDLPGISSLNQLYRDPIHASHDLGRYIAGVTTYSTLFKEDPAGLTAPEGFYGSGSAIFTPELYEAIHETVWQVVREDSLQFEGDFSGNGLVEQADLDLVLGNWGQSADLVPDGWNFHLPSGTIDQDELDQVLANWGGPAPPAGVGSANPVPVPEPSTGTILICLAVLRYVGPSLLRCVRQS